MTDAIADFKSRVRKTWATGDYDTVSEMIQDVGQAVVDAAGIRPGAELLDVAAGTGNVAVKAAVAGADVTASDLTPELFDAGRRRAEAAGVEFEWIEADAEALPFADASFDVVTSCFGAIFAPRHEVAATELTRVLRPGGTLVMTGWTPEGFVGTFFTTVAGFMPPPPDFASPPVLWGSEAHVQEVFAGKGLDLSLDRKVTRFEFDSIDAMLDFYMSNFGPIVLARPMLESQGRWDEFVSTLRGLFADEAGGSDTKVDIEAEYLLIVGRKQA
jgi:SAM-dependent methyltransferase